MRWVTIDFETRSTVDVRKVGAWRYAQDPMTEVLCVCYAICGSGHVSEWTPGADDTELRALAEEPDTFFESFGDFERAVWAHKMVDEFGFPELPNNRWHDIQAVAAMKGLPKSLEDLVAFLKLGEKDMEGNKLTVSLSRPSRKGAYPTITPDVRKRVVEYCADDVRKEAAASTKIGWLPPGERSMWLLNQRINRRGIGIDLEYVAACQEIVDKASVPLVAEFEKITGLLPSQREKVMQWLVDQNVRLPNLTKETMAELFPEEPDDADTSGEGYLETCYGMALPAHVDRALRIRQLVTSTSIAKLAAMRACTGLDGRARGLLQYHGTGPGRSAGRLIQPQNFPRPTFKADIDALVDAIMTRDPEMVELTTGVGAIPAIAGGLRHAIVAGPDRVLMSADYAGIQARLVLAVAGQHDKTKLMAEGKDVYCDMATAIYKYECNKKEHPAERSVGKNAVLGLGFQMGADTFQEKYARRQPLAFVEKVVHTYRKEWAPEVPKVWYGLEDAATAAVWDEEGIEHEAFGIVYQMEEGWLSCRLPSGRKIWYPLPQRERKQAPWDRTVIKPGFSYVSFQKGFMQRKPAFGGQLTENVIMGMERDIMGHAQIKLEKNGYPIVLEVHDEVVAEPITRDANSKEYEQILLDVEPWVMQYRVPVAVEGWIGTRYRK